MSDKIYTLSRGPLAFLDLLTCVRESVVAALNEPPERAALAFERGLSWLIPGHARGSVDNGWVPKAADDWVRLGAYSGALDAWNGGHWRATRGQPSEHMEAFAAAYWVARMATLNAAAAAKAKN